MDITPKVEAWVAIVYWDTGKDNGNDNLGSGVRNESVRSGDPVRISLQCFHEGTL